MEAFYEIPADDLRYRRLVNRTAFALLVVAFLCATPAQAQRRPPRRIQLDPLCPMGSGPPRLPVEWMIVAPDPCPGATLLRLCGGEAGSAHASGASTVSSSARTAAGGARVGRWVLITP